jgi:cyclase
MQDSRLIPVLTKSGCRLIKTVGFKDRTYIGDPINTVRILNEMMIDEMFIIDIDQKSNFSDIDFEYLEKISSNCFSPLSYGGGINSLDDARRILACGYEKIVLNRALFKNPELIISISNEFGNQCVVASVDLKYEISGELSIRNDNIGLKNISMLGKWLKEICEKGVGEVMLTDVEREGSFRGSNLELAREVSSFLTVPIIINGGVSGLADAGNLLRSGATAAAASSLFMFEGPSRAVLINYPTNEELISEGFRRLC